MQSIISINIIRIILFAIYLIVLLILYLKFSFNITNIVFCFVLGALAFLYFDEVTIYSFLVSFYLVGLSKILTKILKKDTDLHKYRLENLLYSTAIPILMAILINLFALREMKYYVVLICSLSGIASDTVSSEIGQLRSFKTYLITNLKFVKNGVDGGITIPGTLAGIISSLIFSLIVYFYYDIATKDMIVIILAPIFINLIDSFLGATFQRKKLINNNQTNFVAILLGSLVCYFLY